MKTKVISILVFIVLLSGCSIVKKEKNDLKEMNLKGKVKSIREFSYEAVEKFGEILKGKKERYDFERRDTHIIFNNKGNKIEKNYYKSDGSFDYKDIYKYDDKGNKIEISVYKSDGSFYKESTYKYDDKGNKIEKNYYDSDGSLNYKYTYKYDDKGNKIEGNSYLLDLEVSLGHKYTYKYDDKGNKIGENHYDSDGSFDYKWTYKYDDKGNKIEKNYYKSDGSIDCKWTWEYEYDEKNNWIKQIKFVNKTPKYILEREIEYYH